MADVLKLAPYLVWMALMMAGLPYWLRTVCSGVLLLPLFMANWRHFRIDFVGILAGLLVFALWIAPETLGWVQPAAKPAAQHPYIQLFGSAVVIAAAEELFFREWLYNWLLRSWPRVSAALIMLGLFAVEHDKYVCAVIAGSVYFALYLRRGLKSAVIAHMTTNLALGLHVILTDSWYFW